MSNTCFRSCRVARLPVAVLLIVALVAGARVECAQGFPPPGVDLVEHTLRIGLYVERGGKADLSSKPDETLSFKGRMLIEREEARVSKQTGRNEVPFQVRTWVASAYSQTLQQEILYVLSEDAEQPPSAIQAEQKDADFPATFSFNVIFDVRANNRTVIRRHHGRPEGRGFRVVPPSGDRKESPTITSFETTLISLDHPGKGKIWFKPIDCNDDSGKTLTTARTAGK